MKAHRMSADGKTRIRKVRVEPFNGIHGCEWRGRLRESRILQWFGDGFQGKFRLPERIAAMPRSTSEGIERAEIRKCR